MAQLHDFVFGFEIAQLVLQNFFAHLLQVNLLPANAFNHVVLDEIFIFFLNEVNYPQIPLEVFVNKLEASFRRLGPLYFLLRQKQSAVRKIALHVELVRVVQKLFQPELFSHLDETHFPNHCFIAVSVAFFKKIEQSKYLVLVLVLF
jgi:hypothetical protein